MRFKRVNIEELETEFSPSFIGVPLKRFERFEEFQEKEKEIKILEKGSNILIINEETLEYNYDKDWRLDNFIGTGTITVNNNSKKNRIWDVRLKLSGTENANLEKEKFIKLGNFEPKTNKKLNYSILNLENLPDPVRVTEEIEVQDINTKQIYDTGSDLDELTSISTEPELKSKDLKKERKEEIITEVKEEVFEGVKEEIKEEEPIKLLKDKKKLDTYLPIEEIESTEEDKITKIEGEFSEKEASAKKEVDEEFDPEINSVESKIRVEQEKLDETTRMANDWFAKMNDLDNSVKNLGKKHKTLSKTKSKALNKRLKSIPEEEKSEKAEEYNTSVKEINIEIKALEGEIIEIEDEFLKKEAFAKKEVDEEFDPQINSVESKLSVDQEKLDGAIIRTTELTAKKSELINVVKNLKKNHIALIKAKSKALNTRLKEVSGDEESKEAIETEVEAPYEPEINRVESKLRVEQKKLDDAIERTTGLTAKMSELINVVKNLKKNHAALIKAKSKIPKTKIKKISGEKKSKDAIETEVEATYEPEINRVESKLRVEQENLDDTNEKLAEWTNKVKDLSAIVKKLKKEQENLTKAKSKIPKTKIKKISGEKKSKEAIETEIEATYELEINRVESKLRVEQENLDDTNEKLAEWTNKVKDLSAIVKKLKKELENLIKAESKISNLKLKEISEEKKSKINEIRNQIRAKEKEFSKLEDQTSKKESIVEKEVEQEYDPQIKNVESELSVEQAKLDETRKYFEEWTAKKKELNNNVKKFKKEHAALIKAKSKDLNARLKEISKEKKIKIKKETKETLEPMTSEKTPDITEKTPSIESDIPKIDDLEIDVISSKEKAKEKIEDIPIITKSDKPKIKKNYLLKFNKQNKLKFTINLENTSRFIMEDVKLGKILPEGLTNIKYESENISKLDMQKGILICTKNELNSGEKMSLTIFGDFTPREKKLIGTGNIQLTYNIKDYLISEIEVENFTAYSHAMHAINIREKETEPNKWICSLIFKNNSDLNMVLKSLLVLDKEKKNKYIDLKLSSEKEKKIIKPGEKFISNEWEVEDEFEPKFFRKLKYSVTHQFYRRTKVNMKYSEGAFEIVDLSISKRMSETEIKSFEVTEIENIINIKNIGTIAVNGLEIKEVIPADFIAPLNNSDFQIRTSSGIKDFKDININISPYDDNSSVPHIIELKLENILDINEFLEIRYQFKAITPSYRKDYEFPLEVKSYYPMTKETLKNYYYIENVLTKRELPNLKIIHRRRDLLIGKEIFPGRDVDEFAISITINNNSNIEVNDIKINDTIPKSFELISTNIEYNISESEKGNTITFIIERILPLQEFEIRYYVKNISGESIDYDELESFIYG